MRMRLALLANSRPDCLLEIAQVAQVTKEMYKRQPRICIRRLKKSIRYAIDNRGTLTVPKLDKKGLRIVGFSDVFFAKNHDQSPQLVHIIFLVESNETAIPLFFKSYKARKVTTSAMPGEVIIFSDIFDYSTALSEDITNMFNKRIPVQLLTDRKCLVEVISNGSRTSEKRLMLDIAVPRELFRDKAISDIRFIRSSTNIANGLFKQISQAVLRNVVISGRLDVVSAK